MAWSKAGVKRAAIAATLLLSVMSGRQAHAAGAAYQVDTSEVSDAGNCKVESWVSWASNRDFVTAASPSCAFNVYKPFELSAQISRSRSDGEGATGLVPKAKMKFLDSGLGVFGLAVSVQGAFDLITRENTTVAITLPSTVRLSDTVRVNLNVGWLLDRLTNRDYLTYGAGFDWRTPDNVWTLTGEVFGVAGPHNAADASGLIKPRFQVGMRYRPIDRISFDLIYGRNLGGEEANWITFATIVRFPAPGASGKGQE